MQNTSEIEELVKLISKLPGLGPKSAKRIVLKLINNRDELVKPLAKTLAEVYKNISRCKICGVLKSSAVECSYDNCKVIQRKYNQICVVENIADQWSIENSGAFAVSGKARPGQDFLCQKMSAGPAVETASLT